MHLPTIQRYLLLLLLLPLSTPAEWAVNLYRYGDEARATFTENGIGAYTLLFGYGGCVAQALDHDDAYADCFAGPYQQEETDRVLQTVLWGTSDNANVGTHYGTRWNINQAGTFGNVPAEILSVALTQNHKLELYSLNTRQWYAWMGPAYRGSQGVSQFTQYQSESNGVLRVRTVTRIPRIAKAGVLQEHFTAYLEHWSAFKNVEHGHGFNAVACRADAEGLPTLWYSARPSEGAKALPDYPNWPLNNSRLNSGYAIAFLAGQPMERDVAAMVFGTQQVKRPASKAWSRSVLNFKYWLPPITNPGIGILPGIYIEEAQPGTLVDSEYKLILRPRSGKAFIKEVTQAVDRVQPARIYGPGEPVPPSLAAVRENLDRIIEEGWRGKPFKAYWRENGVLERRIERLRSGER